MSIFRQKISNFSKNRQDCSNFACRMSFFRAKIENQGNLSKIVQKKEFVALKNVDFSSKIANFSKLGSENC